MRITLMNELAEPTTIHWHGVSAPHAMGGLSTLCAVLSVEGYQIAEAEDGASAIAQVEAHFYDLILMDVRMVHMDGMAALRAIKHAALTSPSSS